MHKHVHLILGGMILSHVGRAVLSVFYEKSPDTFIVPVIHAAFIWLAIGAWRRRPKAVVLCALASVCTMTIQGIFIWKREAYSTLSIPVLIFEIIGIVAALLYLIFFFSSHRDRYFEKANVA
jgi:hypothetical protein